ncbi:hypothetical protein L2E82_26899 [Cichorium intybus]|uniref:Uncharacterized protein n=1 Tax=Cichorium intybus TaxID=13427 RepID=A0ACB9CRR3_CICIN|nr:hypothetical protein L2E82_26899 [Cichorium intybus]
MEKYPTITDQTIRVGPSAQNTLRICDTVDYDDGSSLFEKSKSIDSREDALFTEKSGGATDFNLPGMKSVMDLGDDQVV